MSEDLIKRSDAIKAYNEAMEELVKWQMEEWQLGDFSECEFNTTDCKHIVRKIEAIPSEDRPQEWIPCSERLPKENTEVLMSLEWGIDIGEYRNGDWHSEWINYYDDGDVLAWMPLPKPWKGADDE